MPFCSIAILYQENKKIVLPIKTKCMAKNAEFEREKIQQNCGISAQNFGVKCSHDAQQWIVSTTLSLE